MAEKIDFQTIILRLQNFWAEHGCLIWQPYHTEVGAGTMNPATYLRVLGPEPWNVAYVEPSIRPDDGRYGENPNRLQQHYQYQVILKPDPGNPQELYLESLRALGLNPRDHDIRFIEDNWESPALGAWGLGWEVWLNGMEITQFTYFQQAGGFVLDPVAVELTYGLERIAMALMGVHDFRNIQWNSSFRGSAAYTYGDVNLMGEYEHSKYFFEIADVERLRQNYATYVHEAGACLEQGLVLPAHDYILKCSHTFNVLDTRGAIGVTERQAMFGVMRDLARRSAEAYLAQREKMGFPWLQRANKPETVVAPKSTVSNPAAPSALLFEIGTEELPHGDLIAALSQLNERVPALFDELRLAHGKITVSGTTRRLVVHIEDLSTRQTDLEQVVKGPPAERAFDAQGKATPAGEGFARSRGVAVSDLDIREMDGGKYVTAIVRATGKPTIEVLSEALPGLIASIKFEKSMRWNHTNVAFSRPIRWLLALYGSQVVPFEYAGLQSSNRTRGLRFYEPQEITIHTPQEYFQSLKSQGIILDVEERRAVIKLNAQQAALQVPGEIPDDQALLAQVSSEVEAVTALVGSFDPKSLELPQEVLIAVMKKHQKYFPVLQGMGNNTLLPHFVALRNGDKQGLDLVRHGNEDVIRARFADAAFFIKEDKLHKLEDHLPKLGTLTFQKELGSMLDKSRRLVSMSADLGAMLGLTSDETNVLSRAAELSKAELVTKMVVEMTSLQGIIGRYYALYSGEPAQVADALFEQYLPRFSGDETSKTRVGLALGIADRLDTLAGLFSVGLAPTGAKDPFAQRRAALGLVQNLIAWDLDFNLRDALHIAAQRLPVRTDPDKLENCLGFIEERLRNYLLEQGYRYDVVDAVISRQGRNPAKAMRAVRELSLWVVREDWQSVILPAFARCARITRPVEEKYVVLPEALVEPAEKGLVKAMREAAEQVKPGLVDSLLHALVPMVPAINRFFEEVLVMAEDPALRSNRLGILQNIVSMSDDVVDMSKLEGF